MSSAEQKNTTLSAEGVRTGAIPSKRVGAERRCFAMQRVLRCCKREPADEPAAAAGEARARLVRSTRVCVCKPCSVRFGESGPLYARTDGSVSLARLRSFARGRASRWLAGINVAYAEARRRAEHQQTLRAAGVQQATDRRYGESEGNGGGRPPLTGESR